MTSEGLSALPGVHTVSLLLEILSHSFIALIHSLNEHLSKMFDTFEDVDL
jgi:hypothetical protein